MRRHWAGTARLFSPRGFPPMRARNCARRKSASRRWARCAPSAPRTRTRRTQILDAYFAHKDGRAVHPVAPADIAATRAFYRSLALGAGAAPPIELHALALDGKIIAVLGAGRNGGRLQGMFISYDPDPDIARSSPGELLLCAVLRDACARNLSSFDLGVGDARYKTTFCDESERLVEALYAPTWAGRLAAPFFALASTAKAAIKHNPRLFALARRARGL